MNRVSVIIPVYNSEKTIEQVLLSVVEQTAISEILEVIVVDDGSRDTSAIVIQAFIKAHPELHIRYIKQENGGASAARNHGMKEANGEFIALLDSDDLWLPNKIERQLEVIDQNPEIVFLGTSYVLGTDKKEVPLVLYGKAINTLFKATLKDIYWKHFPVTPSVIFRRSAINTIGYFDETQKYGEDINYFQKFCIHFNYYYLPEYLLHIAFNKTYFGSEGLSSNFKGMHEGGLKNLGELKNGGYFSASEYLCYRAYFQLKYWRRIIIRILNSMNYK